MAEFATTNGHPQIIIPLTITPFSHQASPTITGSLLSNEAGAVLYGHYQMEYLLPQGDRLRLIANHNQKTVQLMLFTYQNELLSLLPGRRPASLIAEMISNVHRYRIRSASYKQPLTMDQEQKLHIANACIKKLEPLLKKERHLNNSDHEGHAVLRRTALAIIEHSRDKNRLLANNPLISEGTLGDCLFAARKTAQHYTFNRTYAVSRQDQMDFSKIKKSPPQKTCLVWDSELHIGHDSKELDNALRVICQYYHLTPAPSLNNVPANRFAKVTTFFHKMWHDGHDWINYLATDVKPQHKTEIEQAREGLMITHITPYYRLQGLSQKGYRNLNTLMAYLLKNPSPALSAANTEQAQKILEQRSSGAWAVIASEQRILLRQENKLLYLGYFIQDGLFYPMPCGQDLYTLAQVSKRHLYLPERVSLKVKAFLSRAPGFFVNFYQSMQRFIVHDLHEEFVNHVHATHTPKPSAAQKNKSPNPLSHKRNSLVQALENNGLLTNGQTLEAFIHEQINNSPYVIARANHPPSPPAYDNPLHRALGIIRHIASIFIDTSERNPIIGTLAMAAYAYGGGAIIAPDTLKSILTKLHLHGLIAGIEPTQKLAHLLNHGTISEAISASALYWQGAVAGGNLDQFFIEAINLLKEDPAEIAIIGALALSLGYGLTQVIPALGHEMGDFPYTNYAALGAKSGAAVYDTIMHPGDDWFLGTGKWLGGNLLLLAKLIIAPCIEGYYYGFDAGFMNGWRKSGILLIKSGKQLLAAGADLLFALLTIPLLEISTLFIHVPFRGISGLLTKTLSMFGNLTPIGEALLAFATRPPLTNLLARFRFSPLYGFRSPFGHFSENKLINGGINIMRLLVLPGLQLLKNLLILPIIDLLSLLVRLGIMILNPLSRLVTYALGQIIYTVGTIWDPSIGCLFTASAQGLSLLFNGLDNAAAAIKQNLLSSIEIARAHLYQWAFIEEDVPLPASITDEEYYSSTPKRCELIPHNDQGCLLKMLLDESCEKPAAPPPAETNPIHSQLFVKSSISTSGQVISDERRPEKLSMPIN